MTESILDYILADSSYTLAETVDIISFHLQDSPPEVLEEVKQDLEHAFLGDSA